MIALDVIVYAFLAFIAVIYFLPPRTPKHKA
jgi:hypothetical protein